MTGLRILEPDRLLDVMSFRSGSRPRLYDLEQPRPNERRRGAVAVDALAETRPPT